MLYTQHIPQYAKQDFERLGYKFEVMQSHVNQVIANDKDIIWHESELQSVLEHIDLINDHNQKNVLIIEHHHAIHYMLKQLDALARPNKLTVFGYYPTVELYKNIKCHSVNGQELQCNHDFVHYLVRRWHANRSQQVNDKMLFMSANKQDQQRNWLFNTIKDNHQGLWIDVEQQTADQLYAKRNEFNAWVNHTFNGSNMLGGFGNGTPRFDLYDKVFGEVVLETNYTGPFIHVTEKTWKPFACGVPALLVISASNIKWLEDQGYSLQPKALYDDLRNNSDYRALPEIVKPYLQRLEVHRQVLTESARHNYNHFWRINSYWEKFGGALEKVFGHSPIKELEKKLKEV
jgi:hypothetical protein